MAAKSRTRRQRAAAPGRATPALVVGALGVVFGDIGTSPLYTVQTVFNPRDPHPVAASVHNIFGVVSLIFWAVTVVVTITYVVLVMRADNDGEGGIMALITLVRRRDTGGSARTRWVLAALGLFGASLFFGDSMITPAISVLSAVEGVKVAQPSLASAVVPVTVGVIVALFLVQRLGSGRVGSVFGPVMVAWFLVVAACGLSGISHHPQVLKALSPTYAVNFLVNDFATAFFALTAVVLAVTGAEALYADMGHFGRPAITRSWLGLVFPAVILSYLGQGALIIDDPKNISSPFFLLAPHWGRWPLVFLAAAATVIASQAVITGAFSLAHQAIQLGYLPRLRVVHTSAKAVGQIYVPWFNWLLMVSVVALVLAFESSAALAYAYGMAVTGTITITTLLFFYIARNRWRKPVWLVVLGAAPLLVIDLLFLAANATKFTRGAWLPLLIAVVAFTVMTTWQRGREIVTRRREEAEGPLRGFIDELRTRTPRVRRVPGTAVFLNRNMETAPLAMRASVDHLHALSENVVILSIETPPVPHVAPAERLVIDDLGYRDDGITRAHARFGYMDKTNVPVVLRQVARAGIEAPIDVKDASYFLSTIEVSVGDDRTMSLWRKRLFVATARISVDPADYFSLPRERTVIIGSRIDV
jgi:KUP system potassium uptake protein